MKTWPIYLMLQNHLAYGGGIGSPSGSSETINALGAEYLLRIWTQRDLRGSVVLGPGGPAEIGQLLPALPKPIHAITAHEPEAHLIRDAFQGRDDVHATFGDMHELPYESEIVDVVYASNVLEHAIAPYAALMQCRRVLRDGGLGIFVLPSFAGAEGGRGPFHLHCLDREVWIELLRKCGFVLVDSIEQRAANGDGGYHHFRCVAVAPPTPHDRILNELKTYHASRR